MEQEIDFSKAPGGATHYVITARKSDDYIIWYKRVNGGWSYWQNGDGWTPSFSFGLRVEIPKSQPIKEALLNLNAEAMASFAYQAIGRPVFTKAMAEAGEMPPIGCEIEYVISPRQDEPTNATVLSQHNRWIWALVKIGACEPKPVGLMVDEITFVFDDKGETDEVTERITEDFKSLIPEIHWHYIPGIVDGIKAGDVRGVVVDNKKY